MIFINVIVYDTQDIKVRILDAAVHVRIAFIHQMNSRTSFFSECDSGTFGYGCNQSCDCNFGTCNPNATTAGNSCICPEYILPNCSTRIDKCGKHRRKL